MPPEVTSGRASTSRGAGLPVVADPTLRRVGGAVWLGGSPLRLFRVSPRGDALLGELVGDTAGGRRATTVAEHRLHDRLVAAGAAHPVPVPGEGPPPRSVSVVVPVRDDPVGLDALLASLDAAEVLEVVVVDDGSVAPAATAVAEIAELHGARRFRHGRGRGPGAARNSGWRAARGEVVAFLDADVEVPPGWLTPLLAHLSEDRVAAVAPRVRSQPVPGLRGAYERARSPLDLGGAPGRVAAGSPVPYVPSAALVVRRGCLEELGGFEEGLVHGEDVDLVWRAVEAGMDVRYEPAVTVLHRPRATWPAWIRQRFGYGTSAAALDQRHPGRVAPVVMSPWSLAVWIAAGTGHPVVAASLAGATAAALVRKLPDVPTHTAVRLALRGHALAGLQLARAGSREWWPLLVVGSVVSQRVRRVATASVVARLATTPGGSRLAAVAVLDDLAYGAGVWRGAISARSARSLLARLVSWP